MWRAGLKPGAVELSGRLATVRAGCAVDRTSLPRRRGGASDNRAAPVTWARADDEAADRFSHDSLPARPGHAAATINRGLRVRGRGVRSGMKSSSAVIAREACRYAFGEQGHQSFALRAGAAARRRSHARAARDAVEIACSSSGQPAQIDDPEVQARKNRAKASSNIKMVSYVAR